MSARGPGRGKGTAGQSDARRRGEVSVQMTASDILSVAVNVAQNEWSLEGCDSPALRKMLEEVFEQALGANRRAISKARNP